MIEKGDLVYIDFNPQAGREALGNRPAIVLSPKKFNEITGFATVCPITRTVKGWGFEVELPEGLKLEGAIMTDQVKNLDWKARNIKKVDEAPYEVVKKCIDKIHTFIDY